MYVSTNPRRVLQSLGPQVFNFACWKYWRKESKKSKFPLNAARRDTSVLKYEQWGRVLINVIDLLLCSPLSQLRKAVMDHISDSFLETNVPLLVLIEAAKSGNEKEVKEYAQVFREHANKLVEVSDLSDMARFPSGALKRGRKRDILDGMLEVLFWRFGQLHAGDCPGNVWMTGRGKFCVLVAH